MAKKLKIPWGDSFVRQEKSWAEIDGKIKAVMLLIMVPFLVFLIIFSNIFSEDKAFDWAWKAGFATTALIFMLYNIYTKDN